MKRHQYKRISIQNWSPSFLALLDRLQETICDAMPLWDEWNQQKSSLPPVDPGALEIKSGPGVLQKEHELPRALPLVEVSEARSRENPPVKPSGPPISKREQRRLKRDAVGVATPTEPDTTAVPVADKKDSAEAKKKSQARETRRLEAQRAAEERRLVDEKAALEEARILAEREQARLKDREERAEKIKGFQAVFPIFFTQIARLPVELDLRAINVLGKAKSTALKKQMGESPKHIYEILTLILGAEHRDILEFLFDEKSITFLNECLKVATEKRLVLLKSEARLQIRGEISQLLSGKKYSDPDLEPVVQALQQLICTQHGLSSEEAQDVLIDILIETPIRIDAKLAQFFWVVFESAPRVQKVRSLAHIASWVIVHFNPQITKDLATLSEENPSLAAFRFWCRSIDGSVANAEEDLVRPSDLSPTALSEFVSSHAKMWHELTQQLNAMENPDPNIFLNILMGLEQSLNFMFAFSEPEHPIQYYKWLEPFMRHFKSSGIHREACSNLVKRYIQQVHHRSTMKIFKTTKMAQDLTYYGMTDCLHALFSREFDSDIADNTSAFLSQNPDLMPTTGAHIIPTLLRRGTITNFLNFQIIDSSPETIQALHEIALAAVRWTEAPSGIRDYCDKILSPLMRMPDAALWDDTAILAIFMLIFFSRADSNPALQDTISPFVSRVLRRRAEDKFLNPDHMPALAIYWIHLRLSYGLSEDEESNAVFRDFEASIEHTGAQKEMWAKIRLALGLLGTTAEFLEKADQALHQISTHYPKSCPIGISILILAIGRLKVEVFTKMNLHMNAAWQKLQIVAQLKRLQIHHHYANRLFNELTQACAQVEFDNQGPPDDGVSIPGYEDILERKRRSIPSQILYGDPMHGRFSGQEGATGDILSVVTVEIVVQLMIGAVHELQAASTSEAVIDAHVTTSRGILGRLAKMKPDPAKTDIDNVILVRLNHFSSMPKKLRAAFFEFVKIRPKAQVLLEVSNTELADADGWCLLTEIAKNIALQKLDFRNQVAMSQNNLNQICKGIVHRPQKEKNVIVLSFEDVLPPTGAPLVFQEKDILALAETIPFLYIKHPDRLVPGELQIAIAAKRSRLMASLRLRMGDVQEEIIQV